MKYDLLVKGGTLVDPAQRTSVAYGTSGLRQGGLPLSGSVSKRTKPAR